MKIIKEFPLNIDQIRAVFDLYDKKPVFTYGDTVYAPFLDTDDLTPDLKVHEQTHMVQQGVDPAAWWNLYLTDSAFRLAQEAVAYQNQYKFFCEFNKNRKDRHSFLTKIARDLSSKMYGNIVSFAYAKELISQ